ncbi:MAG: DUF3047 domain-containing protein [Rhodospirillales bacterium]|nr:DUF3047 domain-containing protein [Rhodospirillales bacterium]
MRKTKQWINKQHVLPTLTLLSALMVATSSSAQEEVVISNFKSGNLVGWEEKLFKDKTKYELVESNGKTVLKASSKASASGMFKEMAIDLTKTPCLNWTWKVDNTLEGLDETTKSGDDYPARVYVVFSGGMFFWKTRALNYVWSSNQKIGSSWPNAFTGNSLNIAAQSGNNKAGQWVKQSHNIRADYKRLVGDDIKQADAVAIMTDTDNSGQNARAYYSEIKFTPSC